MARGETERGRSYVYQAPVDDVFRATLDTVRSIPGWEVIQARPDEHALQARARGRIFSPTLDYEFVLKTTDEGTTVVLRSRATRTQTEHDDARGAEIFHSMMVDRFARNGDQG